MSHEPTWQTFALAIFAFPTISGLALVAAAQQYAEYRRFWSTKIHGGFWKSMVIALVHLFGIGYGCVYCMSAWFGLDPAARTQINQMMWLFYVWFFPFMFAGTYSIFGVWSPEEKAMIARRG